MTKTINWFRKRGRIYRSFPWRQDFLYKYSRGVCLDLGCGLAATTRYLLKSRYLNRLVLLDIVEETLMEISNSNELIIHVDSDILQIPFRENIFDTVCLLAVIHHIPGRECREYVLREVYSVLKPGGYAIITTWSPDLSILLGREKYIELSGRAYLLIDKYGDRYYYFYEINELVEQLQNSGFVIIENGFFVQNPSEPAITRNIYAVASKPSFSR